MPTAGDAAAAPGAGRLRTAAAVQADAVRLALQVDRVAVIDVDLPPKLTTTLHPNIYTSHPQMEGDRGTDRENNEHASVATPELGPQARKELHHSTKARHCCQISVHHQPKVGLLYLVGRD